ncbi:MAG: hypothetical protein AAFQ17_00020 [Pseudomonadota bacterium]
MARVRGVKEVRKAILRAPQALKDEALDEVRNSTKAMHADVRRRFNTASSYAAFWHGGVGMQNISGQLRRLYRWSVSKSQLRGRVGILSRQSARRVFYLRFFLYGTRDQPARNVHDDAFEAEREVYIDAQTKALRRVLKKIFG